MSYIGYLIQDFFFLKILLLKRIRFMTRKNAAMMSRTRMGCSGAMAAKSISGKPNTMAGKF